MEYNGRPLIVGPDGKQVQSSRYDDCTCGASYKDRVPSSGFGRNRYMVCKKCGHEFKEIPCESVM